MGELNGGVTGALEEPPPGMVCNGGKTPVLLVVLAVPLEPNPFNHGMSDVPSGYELAGLTSDAGDVHISIRSAGGLEPCNGDTKW